MAMDVEKQTLVRVKRKRNDDPYDRLWLEVTPKPAKRQEAALPNLSLNETADLPQGASSFHSMILYPSGKLRTGDLPNYHIGDLRSSSRSLYQRVETFTSSGVRDLDIPDFLRRVKDAKYTQESRDDATTSTIQERNEQLPSTATAPVERSSGKASFQQIRQSRKRSLPSKVDPMQDFFRLYDVVRVDDEEDNAKAGRRSQAKREAEAELREGQLLCNYLPMLREVIPSAAAEIDDKAALSARSFTGADDYVYDVYVLNDGLADSEMREASGPLVKIMEHEYWDDEEAVESDVDSEDSNCEDNPQNDYPDEEDSSREISPYGSDNEEYDTVLSDEEEEFRRWR